MLATTVEEIMNLIRRKQLLNAPITVSEAKLLKLVAESWHNGDTADELAPELAAGAVEKGAE